VAKGTLADEACLAPALTAGDAVQQRCISEALNTVVMRRCVEQFHRLELNTYTHACMHACVNINI
jgi:hypothetical protein